MKDSYDAIEKIRYGGSNVQNKKVLLDESERAEQSNEQQVCVCVCGVCGGGGDWVNLCVCKKLCIYKLSLTTRCN